MSARQGQRRQEKGWVAVAVALGLSTLISILILVTDIGKVLAARAAMQRAADAGALGGAFTFVAEPLSTDPALLARRQAMATTLANRVHNQVIEAEEVNVTVDVAQRRVTVSLTRTEPTFLARLIGRNSIATAVTATAEADVAGTASKCVKPIFIPNWFLVEDVPSGKDVKQDGYLDPSDNPCNSCPVGSAENPSGYDMLVSGNEWEHYAEGTGPGALDTSDPSDDDENWNSGWAPKVLIQNGSVTPFAADMISADPPVKITARVADTKDALSPSSYYSFQFPGYPGGADYRKFLWACSPLPIRCGDCIQVKTGGMQGNTYDGLSDLLALNPDGMDVFLSPGQYQHTDAEGSTFITSTSVQVGLAPIWDPCMDNDCFLKFDFCPHGEFPSGNNDQSVPIVGFAVIFIASQPVHPKSDVDVYLIDVIPCADDSGSSIGPLAQPVRLVRTS